MHTLNYDIGENVSCDVFYFTPDGTEDSLSVSADVNKINELLRIYKLRKDDIVNRYTVKFERKD